jgi:TonB family protein
MYLGPKHKARAILLTIIVFSILIAILLWVKFHTPIPPYPEGGGGPGMGLEVNLGSDVVASSVSQSEEEITMPDFKPTPKIEQEEEKILTRDDEEEAIKTVTKNVKKNISQDKKQPSKNTEPQRTELKLPVINEKALFKAGKKSSSDENGADEKGNRDGSPGKSTYSGSDEGSGNGKGGGKGNGMGSGVGDGISFSLEGRIPSYLDVPKENFTEQGKVVVEITVDNNGNVINANPGVKGSNTLDDNLLQIAKKAALKSKFNRKPSSTIQKGTITYRFVLQ